MAITCGKKARKTGGNRHAVKRAYRGGRASSDARRARLIGKHTYGHTVDTVLKYFEGRE